MNPSHRMRIVLGILALVLLSGCNTSSEPGSGGAALAVAPVRQVAPPTLGDNAAIPTANTVALPQATLASPP